MDKLEKLRRLMLSAQNGTSEMSLDSNIPYFTENDIPGLVKKGSDRFEEGLANGGIEDPDDRFKTIFRDTAEEELTDMTDGGRKGLLNTARLRVSGKLKPRMDFSN